LISKSPELRRFKGLLVLGKGVISLQTILRRLSDPVEQVAGLSFEHGLKPFALPTPPQPPKHLRILIFWPDVPLLRQIVAGSRGIVA
jgi:hypothetical protein